MPLIPGAFCGLLGDTILFSVLILDFGLLCRFFNSHVVGLKKRELFISTTASPCTLSMRLPSPSLKGQDLASIYIERRY